ncbi:MAG TPA: CaiB/BaiF CoA-transferase family protein [Myxococcota bacterium]|nr:CaiB/BaiF CoA-transferase family protein [Myxococcota bacterium]
MPGPLEGIRVVELGVWVAGPAAGCILADWGADVVKIEPPGIGDPARTFSRMLGADLPSNPIFENDNRSKRSIALDLAADAGRGIAQELLDRADVFVTNVRMAGLARLGLDPKSLQARNPRLVYGAISGYGFSGPDADRAAYDIAGFWARSGIAAALTSKGHHPPFQRGGMGDHNAGLALAGGISAALFRREKSGEGQLVMTSLLREGLYTLSFDLSVAVRFGVGIAVADRAAMGNPCINNYQDKDGRWFWLVGLEGERHWPPLARVAGHPEWIEDARFATPAQRAVNARALIAELDAVFATRSREEWAQVFDGERDLWWAPVQSVDEVLADPQVHAAGGFVEVPDGEATTLLPATPVDFEGTPSGPRAMAPALGEHSDAILGELGRSPAQIAALRAQKVVS